jgi:hypothetical protein
MQTDNLLKSLIFYSSISPAFKFLVWIKLPVLIIKNECGFVPKHYYTTEFLSFLNGRLHSRVQ